MWNDVPPFLLREFGVCPPATALRRTGNRGSGAFAHCQDGRMRAVEQEPKMRPSAAVRAWPQQLLNVLPAGLGNGATVDCRFVLAASSAEQCFGKRGEGQSIFRPGRRIHESVRILVCPDRISNVLLQFQVSGASGFAPDCLQGMKRVPPRLAGTLGPVVGKAPGFVQ